MIRFENVHKRYKTGTDALRGVTFSIADGEFVFVIGKSGSGKSTLMKCITREERPTEGYVIIDKFCISKMPRALIPVLRRQIGIIYQDFRLIETKTVEENVAFAGEIIGVPRKQLKQMVDIVLGAVGLRDKANAMPLELSGGEQQRIAIARAMLNHPKLIVADEPTGNLDPETSESIMALLQEINRQGTTVIVCTHDSNMVDRMKKRVIEVDDGLIVRDEKGSGYTAVVEHWPPALPKSMQDEFVPEVVDYKELQETDVEPEDRPLPEFPNMQGEQKKEAVVEQVPEIIVMDTEEPVTEPVAEPVEETVTEENEETTETPASEETVEPVSEPVCEPLVEEKDESVVEEKADPVVEPRIEEMAEPVVNEKVETAIEPVVDEKAETPIEPVVEEKTRSEYLDDPDILEEEDDE